MAGEYLHAQTEKASLLDTDLLYVESAEPADYKLTGLSLKDTLKTYFDTLYSVAGNIKSGTGVYAGSAGVVVNIGEDLGGTAYRVVVTSTCAFASALYVGDVTITAKTSTTFTVANGGNAGATFDWILVDNN